MRAMNEGMGWGPGPPAWLPGPREVRLAWLGRAIDGQLWAYVVWLATAWPTSQAEAASADGVVLCCGMLPTWALRPVPGEDYGVDQVLPRLELPADVERWPDPAADWAAERGWPLRRSGLMGYQLYALGGPPAPDDSPRPAARRPRSAGTGMTLAERAAQAREQT